MKANMIFRSLCAVASCAVALGGSACSGNKPQGPSSSESKPAGEVVAQVGDGQITVDEFKAKLAEQPPMTQGRMATPQGKKEFLDNLEKFELLSQEATRRGIDKSPTVQNTIKRILVQELVNQYYQAKIEPTDDELKGYYEKHKTEFAKPEMRQVQQIFISAQEAPTPAAKEARTKAKQKAQQLLARLKAADVKVAIAADPNGTLAALPAMADLAKANSNDDRTKNNGGTTRFEQKESMGAEYSLQLANAVFALTPEHRLSDVIETPKGYHVARLLGVQAATTKTLDDPTVKNTVKDRFVQDQRRERFDTFYNDLKKSTKIDVNDKVLASIEVPAGKAPGQPGQPGAARGGMPPGFGRPPMGGVQGSRPGMGLPPGGHFPPQMNRGQPTRPMPGAPPPAHP